MNAAVKENIMNAALKGRVMRRAALVGVLAGALATAAAHAGIVYTQPPAPITLTVVQDDDVRSAPLDLDSDGVPEFLISAHFWLWFEFSIHPTSPGAALQNRNSESLSRLPAGVALGPPDACTWGGQLLFYNSGFVTGPFGEWEPDLTPAFFGVRFDIGGQSHFGWVRAQLTDSINAVTISVFDYAYESVPNAPIVTGAIPAPGAAVVLSLASITSFRRRRS